MFNEGRNACTGTHITDMMNSNTIKFKHFPQFAYRQHRKLNVGQGTRCQRRKTSRLPTEMFNKKLDAMFTLVYEIVHKSSYFFKPSRLFVLIHTDNFLQSCSTFKMLFYKYPPREFKTCHIFRIIWTNSHYSLFFGADTAILSKTRRLSPVIPGFVSTP